MMAALIGIGLGRLEESGAIDSAWRMMFVVGVLPAFLCIPIFRKLKEPERGCEGKEGGGGKPLGSMFDLFHEPRWRKNAIVGMLLAFSGVVGLWGIGFFSFDLLRSVLDKTDMNAGQKTFWTGMTSLLQNAGAFLGIYGFTHLTARTGRRPAFAISFVAADAGHCLHVLEPRRLHGYLLDDSADGLLPACAVRRLCDLSAGTLPDATAQHGHLVLLQRGPLRRRDRPLTLGLLTSRVYAGYDEPMRYAGVTMCAVFLIGLATLPFAPETKGAAAGVAVPDAPTPACCLLSIWPAASPSSSAAPLGSVERSRSGSPKRARTSSPPGGGRRWSTRPASRRQAGRQTIACTVDARTAHARRPAGSRRRRARTRRRARQRRRNDLRKPTLEMSEPEWQDMLDLNATATLLACQMFSRRSPTRPRTDHQHRLVQFVRELQEVTATRLRKPRDGAHRSLAVEWATSVSMSTRLPPACSGPLNRVCSTRPTAGASC